MCPLPVPILALAGLATSIAWNIALIVKKTKQICVNRANDRYIMFNILESRSSDFLFPVDKEDVPNILAARIQLRKRIVTSMLVAFVAASTAELLCK